MISLRLFPLLSLAGLIVLSAVVLGQETDVTNISAGSTTLPTATSVRILCSIPENDPQVNENITMAENASNLPALPSGVECYNVLPNGMPESTPFTTIDFPGPGIITTTNDIASSENTASGFGAITGSFDPESSSFPTLSGGVSSNNNNLKVVLPAVLCSVLVACLLVVGLLWFRRTRNRNSTRRQSMRDWVNRPGGWVGDRKEEQTEIALHERQPSQI